MPAPADAVYAAVTDLRARPRWLTEMSDVEAPPGPVEPGTRFSANSALLLHTFHGVSEVQAADGGTSLVEEVHIGARFHSTWTIEPTATGSVLRHRIDVDLPTGPLGWLARAVLGWRLRRMTRHSLAVLADRLSRAA
jgi:hypothetical protein